MFTIWMGTNGVQIGMLYRPPLATKLSFSNLNLGVSAQNWVPVTGPGLGVKMELLKWGFGGP